MCKPAQWRGIPLPREESRFHCLAGVSNLSDRQHAESLEFIHTITLVPWHISCTLGLTCFQPPQVSDHNLTRVPHLWRKGAIEVRREHRQLRSAACRPTRQSRIASWRKSSFQARAGASFFDCHGYRLNFTRSRLLGGAWWPIWPWLRTLKRPFTG